MKAQIFIILVAVLLFPCLSQSQIEGGNVKSGSQTSRSQPMHDKITREMAMVRENEKTGGGPGEYFVFDQAGMCLEPGWTTGYVVLKDKSVIDDIQLRYDIYHQQMQFIRNDDTLAFSHPEELDYIFLGDRKFVYSEFILDKTVQKGYFEVLHEGQCPLFVRRYITYHMDPEDNINLSNEVYVRECCYYIKKSGHSAEPILANRKSILCAFKDKEQEIGQFMNDNKLTGKTCEELKLVIAFYNSLP